VKIGVLGAGQLGLMLARAGTKLGVECRFMSPDASAPAGRIAELVIADYENDAALAHFAEGLDVATYEFESIPLHSVRTVSEMVPVRPSPGVLEIAQDRLREKQCFERLRIPVPQFAAVDTMSELRKALETIGYPSVLKARCMGYDGKGQSVIRRSNDVPLAWVTTGGTPAIVESWVNFTRELSIIAVRSASGETAFYPLVENFHSDGILRLSLAPAPLSESSLQAIAEEYARRIMDDLEYVGVLAIELFEIDGELWANEMAPRVHNSGHWTIEGADTSQFENHLRAIAGMPLGSTAMAGAVGMVNIIGREVDLVRLAEMHDVHIHMYGKAPAPKRKLGHITVTADNLDGVRNGVSRVRSALAS